MRILMLAQFFHPIIGGEERHVRDLATALSKRGHQVSVATLWRDGLPEREVDQGVTIFRMRGLMQRWRGLFTDTDRTHAPPFPDPQLVKAIGRIVASERIEIVHAHNWLVHSFLPLKRADGPPLVVSLHDLSLICATKAAMHGGQACSGPGFAKCGGCAARHYGGAKGCVTVTANWAASWVERRLVDCFLPVSNAIATACGLSRGSTPFRVVPNFIRDDIAAASEGAPPELVEKLPKQPFVMFAGDLRRFKGIDVLIEAWRGVRDGPPLVLIGRKCQDTPERWPANAHVFHDWPHAAVMHAWSRSLFGVLPSVGPEAFGIVLLEAMASGKPVIGSDIGGIPDIIADNVSGLLVRPGDAGGLGEAITALTESESLRRRLSEGASRRAKAFSASSVTPRIEAVYRDVLADRRKSAAAGEFEGFPRMWLSRQSSGPAARRPASGGDCEPQDPSAAPCDGVFVGFARKEQSIRSGDSASREWRTRAQSAENRDWNEEDGQ